MLKLLKHVFNKKNSSNISDIDKIFLLMYISGCFDELYLLYKFMNSNKNFTFSDILDYLEKRQDFLEEEFNKIENKLNEIH